MGDPRPKGRRRSSLTREKILVAAVEFADEHGVEALSMRKLAGELGFEVMSLYNHVANKADILGGVVDLVIDDVALPPAELDWRSSIHQLVGEAHRALIQHPWITLLWYTTPPGAARLRYLEALLEIFRGRAGFSSEVTRHGFHAVNNHVIGYTLQERELISTLDNPEEAAAEFMAQLSPEAHPRTLAHVQYQLDGHATSSFEVVLDLILDGLVRLGEAS